MSAISRGGKASPCPTMAELTERLLASYAHVGGINHVDGKNLPSKRAIADITVDLLRLLFPGYFDEQPIHSSEIGDVTCALLDSVLRSEEHTSELQSPC